jgi:hypothetical protein
VGKVTLKWLAAKLIMGIWTHISHVPGRKKAKNVNGERLAPGYGPIPSPVKGEIL